MEALRVRDLMTSSVRTVKSTDTLQHLHDLLGDGSIRHVPVLDEDGLLAGLVTHRDFLRRVLAPQADLPAQVQGTLLERMQVGEIMNPDVETIDPDASVREAAQVMLENKYGCLPVVEGDRLVGIITESDYVRCLAALVPEESAAGRRRP
jgi:CBS domain-containing membrane protein